MDEMAFAVNPACHHRIVACANFLHHIRIDIANDAGDPPVIRGVRAGTMNGQPVMHADLAGMDFDRGFVGSANIRDDFLSA